MLKKEKDTTLDYRRNEQIRVPKVRLVDGEGEQLGIVETRDALRKSEYAGLDLVEVAPEAKPPVCKMLDYGKFKFEQDKKAKQAAKKQRQNRVETKEVQLRPVTDTNDINIKVNRSKKFLSENDKVKFVMKFKGRELAHKDQGLNLINEVIQQLDCNIETPPKDQGRSIVAVVAPKAK